MSNALNSLHGTSVHGENTDPLPIPPCSSTPVPVQDQLCIQNWTLSILRIANKGTTNIAGITFPQPDDPSDDEHNDSNQENIAPPISEVPHTSPPVHPLGRMCVAVPFTDDIGTNQAIIAAITRVHNTVDHDESYIGNIEEIIRIACTLCHCGLPSEDDKAAALVARLNQI